MSIPCLTRGTSGPPNVLTDTSTLSVSLDNQGMAILQVTILTKNVTPISNACYTFPLNDVTFQGFIQSDVPRKLPGTEYFEHLITARGMIC